MKRLKHLAMSLILMAWAGMAMGATLHVPADYAKIQDAVNAAANGDEVEVAPGTYTENIDFGGKAIRLYSSTGAGATTIDGTGHYHVVQCVSGEGSATVLEGFAITGGNANGSSFPDYHGGGMYNSFSSPTVTNCTFSANVASGGGGMYNFFSSPTVANCTFSNNSGCAMSNESQSSPTVMNCTFSNNPGCGMCNVYRSNPTVLSCTFSNNSGTYDGGAMSNEARSRPTIANCTFSGNSAPYGGAMWNDFEAGPTVINCTFSNNSATYEGGAMCNYLDVSPTAINCTFSNNSAGHQGGAIYMRGPGCTVTNCTFNNNSATDGGAMFNEESPNGGAAVTNCIVWSNSGGEIVGPATVVYSDVQGGWAGVGNIDSDPLFVNPGDLHLSPGSPCIDAGNDAAVPSWVATDLDGLPRSIDGNGDGLPVVDMGAYERQVPLGEPTPSGSDVLVVPPDTTTGTTPVSITFDEVTADGYTSLTTSPSGPPAPIDFKLGDPATYYEVTTTASYAPPITVCIDYSGMSFQGSPEQLRLYHYEGTQWVDCTTTVDAANQLIYGVVTALSPFAICEPSNTPPVIQAITGPLDPVCVNTIISMGASFSDPDADHAHTAQWDWGDDTSTDGVVNEEDKTASGSHTYSVAGVYAVTFTVTDAAGEPGSGVFEYTVVYDPSAGFVTGGGWIDSPPGAYADDPDLVGKAAFGFVAKYQKGATVPTGNTEFQFKAGDLNFHSSSYDWLVVNQNGSNAQFKGRGTINGAGDYRFQIWAGDGALDTFRIRIWEEDEATAGERDVYDNGTEQAIGGGSIVIHTQ